MKPRVKTIQERFAKASFGRITMAEREEFECEGCKRWKTRALFMCILVGFVGFVLGLEGCYGVLRREREEGERVEWERKAQVMVENFNLSKTQLQSLVLFLSSSPEREIFEKEESEKNHDNVLHKVPSCVNGFEVEGNKSVVPSVTQNVETRMKECETILNCEKLAKSTEEFLNQVTENKLNIFILLSVLLATILSFKLLTHIKNLNPTNQIQHKKQSFQPPISKSGGKRKKLLFLGVFLGISVSVWLFFSMNENIIARQMETLVNMCDERARMLQDQFNVSMNHVQALAILVSTFHHEKNPSAIDQKTFKEYTARTAFERPLTSGVAYALKVTHSERELFEIERGWKIKKMERGGDQREEYSPENLDPSPEKEEYAPVIFSQDTVSHIVSVDMMSGKDDRDNIIRSRSTGKGALTAPFNLLKYNHLGVVLTFAVYKYELPPNATPQERIDATIGYLGASFDVPSLVEKLLQQLASKQKIIVNVYDTTNSSSPIKMYGPDLTGFDNGDDYVSHVDFGDPTRKHEMRCRFKDKAAFPWSAMMASGGVAVIVLLVGHIFYQALNRIEKVEDDYREMSELKGRAEAADVAKSQFLATVSHEIRTPMNGVLGMLQMLTDTDLDATQQDFVMTAQESGKALIMLINEVLDQARIESGRLELETVPFDVRDILDNVLSLFSDKSQAKGIELAVYVSSQVPEVLVGDPGRFRQIITNLVGNSMKFTEQGHIFVSVHLLGEIKKSSDPTNQPSLKTPESEFTTNNTLSGRPIIDRQEIIHKFRTHESPKNPNKPVNLFVTVEDTGVGIPEEAQDRIFTPFMQADSSTSRNYGGTGIGLSISKCLVELMGGEIGFVSKPLIGSTFSFNAVFEKSGVEIVGDVKRYCGEIVSSDFQGMRALVVDGSEIRAEITRYHLQRLGVHADVATDKESALSALLEACSLSGRGSLDMVLVDKEAWGPDSTGLSFPLPLINLQKNGTLMEHWQRIPKLFLLATSLNSSEIEELKSNGYVDSIMKPLRLSMLAACLRKVLGIANKRQVQAKSDSLALKELLKGKNILVVDDNAINRKVAEGALRKYGAVVTCVDSGKDAIRILSPPHEIDACFMDVQMPEMDGFEATRLVRSAEKEFNMPTGKGEMQNYWHVPILAMTADVIQATYEECLRCGMDGYVSKPFEEQQLYTAVAQFLESNSVLDS